MRHAAAYEVIVVGGGHAGTEAALAAARMGRRTLLLTQNIETLGQMSCNPAIGGIGKGHLVTEIDALGGLMAQGADHCGIQFRRLNASKGPAVRATRAQIDRALYRRYVRAALEVQPNLTLFQQAVEDLLVEGGRITGVVTQMGLRFEAPAVVLTVGTFLAGLIHIGDRNYAAGRAGDPPSVLLAARLRELRPRSGRLKTGTPPRLDGRTIDYAKLTEQHGDEMVPVFSFLGDPEQHPRQVPCHITHTNEDTHALIRAGLDRSPLFNGAISGTGPRYCPSIEDKVVRFADRNAHQIFLEPEGLDTHEIYPNGISTSLPFDIQQALVRSVAGLEQVHITRPGYAIEYDFFDPRDLSPWLETRDLSGLYCAGQINGTTGYEEAAAQGLLAGINAGLAVAGREPWYPRRDEAYLGVLIDDLVTRGTDEPYRMFTSRAEYRLQLREDNADLRLTAIGRDLGVVDDMRWRRFSDKQGAIARETERLDGIWLQPDRLDPEAAARILGQALSREQNLSTLLRRPNVHYLELVELAGADVGIRDEEVIEQLEIQARYGGYIDRQNLEIERSRRHEELRLPPDLDFASVRGLSHEVVQKLTRHRPHTLGQASRVSGITPAAISLLLIHLTRRHQLEQQR